MTAMLDPSTRRTLDATSWTLRAARARPTRRSCPEPSRETWLPLASSSPAGSPASAARCRWSTVSRVNYRRAPKAMYTDTFSDKTKGVRQVRCYDECARVFSIRHFHARDRQAISLLSHCMLLKVDVSGQIHAWSVYCDTSYLRLGAEYQGVCFIQGHVCPGLDLSYTDMSQHGGLGSRG